LAKIARRLAVPGQAKAWDDEARRIRQFIDANCWSAHRGSFVGAVGTETVDAALLLLADLGFLPPEDPRFAATVDAVGRDLKRGDFIFRYVERDDYGEPKNAFIVCTYWYINALALLGRRDEARVLFERLLGCRTRHGLFAEHLDTATGEAWGNFVQTYSMVGLITSAIRLSVPWDTAL
ncbi:MAG: glycoside hydrolase family 15 protein, partial [Casimicrobiaceae bacterium]